MQRLFDHEKLELEVYQASLSFIAWPEPALTINDDDYEMPERKICDAHFGLQS